MPTITNNVDNIISEFCLERCDDGHFRIPRNKNMKASVEMFINSSLIPDELCLERLILLAHQNGIVDPLVALPDIYLKEKNFIPTGVSIALQDGISPMLVSPPNDGFTLGWTNLSEGDFSEEKLDGVFSQIMQHIGVFRRSKAIIEESDLWPILQSGAESIYDKWEFSNEDIMGFESNGNAFTQDVTPSVEDILEVFPNEKDRPPMLPDFIPWHDVVTAGRHCLGVLDGGSHFIELNVVDEIISPVIAEKLGLFKGQILTAVHNGPADVGLIAHKKYLPDSKDEIEILAENSNKGRNFWTAFRAGANFAYANRLYIMAQVRDSLRDAFSNSVKLGVVSDVPHDMLEKIFINNKEVYLHRKGSNRALPASFFPEGHRFSSTGRPFYFPAALGQDAYIMTNVKGNSETFYTCSHGTGRRMRIDEAIAVFNKDEIIEQVEKKVRFYRFGKTNFASQAPDAYKEINDVFDILRDFNLAEPIIRLRPIATLKA